MLKQWNHFIDGVWAEPSSSFDPATGEPKSHIAAGNDQDIGQAAAAAHRALPAWRDTRQLDRGRILPEIARIVRAHGQESARIERAETGKPATGIYEIEVSTPYFELFGGLASALHGESIDLGPDYHSYIRREPFGVVGIITPWNAAVNQSARSMASALAAGNTFVCKPSEFTSTAFLKLVACATVEAGFPKGVVNILTDTGADAGAALVNHRDGRKMAFTSFLRARKEIGRIAAERVFPMTLELGGKSPNIVFPDADLDAAVASVLCGFTRNAGQTCVSGSRCSVDAAIHEAFVDRLAASEQAVRAPRRAGKQRRIVHHLEAPSPSMRSPRKNGDACSKSMWKVSGIAVVRQQRR